MKKVGYSTFQLSFELSMSLYFKVVKTVVKNNFCHLQAIFFTNCFV